MNTDRRPKVVAEAAKASEPWWDELTDGLNSGEFSYGEFSYGDFSYGRVQPNVGVRHAPLRHGRPSGIAVDARP